jgi:hypothetical protein
LAEQAMGGHERESVSDETFRDCWSFLIFFLVPPHLQPVEGGGSVKGEKQNSWRAWFSAELGVNATNKKAQNRLRA